MPILVHHMPPWRAPPCACLHPSPPSQPASQPAIPPALEWPSHPSAPPSQTQLFHPDRHRGNEAKEAKAKQKFQAIQGAYEGGLPRGRVGQPAWW